MKGGKYKSQQDLKSGLTELDSGLGFYESFVLADSIKVGEFSSEVQRSTSTSHRYDYMEHLRYLLVRIIEHFLELMNLIQSPPKKNPKTQNPKPKASAFPGSIIFLSHIIFSFHIFQLSPARTDKTKP